MWVLQSLKNTAVAKIKAGTVQIPLQHVLSLVKKRQFAESLLIFTVQSQFLNVRHLC
jgi:hypothetical protein